MGNEVSSLTDEQRAEHRNATIARMDARAAEAAAAEKSRLTALIKARDARIAEQAAADEASPRHLVRSSKGDATTLQHRMRDVSMTSDASPTQSPAANSVEDGETGDDVLRAFQPRKEPIDRAKSSKSLQSALPAHVEEPDPKHLQPVHGSGSGSIKASIRPPIASHRDTQGLVDRAKSTQSQAINQQSGQSRHDETTAKINPIIKSTMVPPIDTSKNSAAPAKGSSIPEITTSVSAKRPMPNTSATEQNSTLKTPKRAALASPQSPDGSTPSLGLGSKKTGKSELSSAARATIEERPPAWYNKLKPGSRRNPDEANASTLLGRLRSDIKKCRGATGAQMEQLFVTIRDELHILAFTKVSGQLLRENRMLHNEDGLPQIFDEAFSNGLRFPWDVRADAEELYNKWCLQDFDTDLLRGIKLGKPGSKNVGKTVDSIDREYKGRAFAKFHGNGLLINGQWWPTQLTTVRDGAHGLPIAGISGTAGEGAYSCIMSAGHGYEDEDHGEWVLYCGTDSKDGTVTDYTQRMLESVENGKPVRLIRSHELKSPFAPEIGFRYDGLYKVMSFERLDDETSTRQRHRFRLERLADQAPIRGEGPAKRPTKQEIEGHKNDKRMRGFT
ncbi:hypothetical protein LTR91_012295 [Friedmanniomyces endolithicus]|uniref:YDG domain-containing protein n=1 Tax=Friedmanniomyces endolithicus TaxID=329885 RepID=A0AAN6KG41_9PEZI|nr:hypothetical protein LTR59_012992 [Friedmanniomyces endolithicus]KAK0792220.1 hypothetical protein LTR38_009977 [Friedmanniomyces endolithicus]KAK0806172.1 hypothetical protein LTR75_007011 [Friedmanniomyces endolithicus]KAK0844879.1 hypothetical protein LTS02_015534 [Friedmanniomyces endolithicus]KAK0857307.1 hypothetical protein LTR03_000797 [Friedmanniomyces endolithicus]